MNAIDAYEQVVEVVVRATPDNNPAIAESKNVREIKRFVISDTHPDLTRIAHYRTDHPLSQYNAWTRFPDAARWFTTRGKAQDALWSIWGERCMKGLGLTGVAERSD